MDTTVEIRFSSLINDNAVFGVIYFNLKDSYPEVEELEISQIPMELVVDNPELASAARYRIKGERFNVKIGPRTISIHCNSKYPGWEIYYGEIVRVINIVKNLGVIKSVTRVGLRYINFLPYNVNIFNDLLLKVMLSGRSVTDSPTTVRYLVRENELISSLTIANFTQAIQDGNTQLGSMIDIDTYQEHGLENFLNNYSAIINKAHQIEKTLFFGLFTPEYLESLDPIYDEN